MVNRWKRSENMWKEQEKVASSETVARAKLGNLYISSDWPEYAVRVILNHSVYRAQQKAKFFRKKLVQSNLS